MGIESIQPKVDIILEHGNSIDIGDLVLRIIHTPGHSQGGICLLNEKDRFLISGDTLFKGSIGRTDLPGGDYDQLLDNISQRLLILDSDICIYPGHGEPSTIGWERKNNPFLT